MAAEPDVGTDVGTDDGTDDEVAFDLTEHVLSLLDDDVRERWGWRRLEVVEPRDPRWRGASTVTLDAGGLDEPMYVGLVHVDAWPGSRSVEFVAYDQRAPAEQRWTPTPPDAWYEALAADWHFECWVKGLTGGRIGGAERVVLDTPPWGSHDGSPVPPTVAEALGVHPLTLHWRDQCTDEMFRRNHGGR